MSRWQDGVGTVGCCDELCSVCDGGCIVVGSRLSAGGCLKSSTRGSTFNSTHATASNLAPAQQQQHPMCRLKTKPTDRKTPRLQKNIK